MAKNNFKHRRDLNRMVVIGSLHSLELEERLTKKGDKMMITGNAYVEVVRGDQVNVIQMKVMAVDTSKLYQGYKTVMEEYKSIAVHGRENADKVKIEGNVELNEYLANDNKVKGFNILNATFFHRLAPTEYEGDMAILDISGVYNGMKEVKDADGIPTGEYKINLLSLKYNSDTKDNDKVNELKDLIISEEGAEYLQSMFTEGDAVALSVDLNRYVVVQEDKQEEGGWGRKVVKRDSYREKFEVMGVSPSKERDEEEVQEIIRLRKVQKADIAGISTDEGKGFGRGVNTTPASNPVVDSNFDDNMPF